MKKARLIVDIAMTVTLLCLMAYSLVGEFAHEVLGTVMLGLFVVHHILNRRWVGTLRKGRYTAFRTLQTVLVFALASTVLASVASGIAMSKHLYTLLPAGNAVLSRGVHLVLAYLNVVLMGLHLGLHWNGMISPVMRKMTASPVKAWGLRLAAFVLAGYGVYAFVRRQFGDYLLMRMQFVFFDYNEPLAYFFLDYAAIMALFVFMGHYLGRLVKQLDGRRRQNLS